MRDYRVSGLVLLAIMLPAAVWAADPMDAYKLTADNQEYIEETFWRGTGNVKVQYQEVTIQCDEMDLNLVTRELTARGNVVLDQSTSRFTADELRYDLRTKTGLFVNATGETAPSYYFTGAEMEKLDDTRYRLKDATFTSCGNQDRPPWRFKIHEALIEEEGYGRFKGTSLWIKGAPVFYVPYIIWPVKKERAAGFLMPSYGYSDVRGAYLGNAFFVPIGRSYDTTVYLDLYSKGHFGIGSEWRWAPGQHSEGEITGYALRHKDSDTWHWKVEGRHKQEDFLGFRLQAEIRDLSDIDFFQEFERSFDKNTLRSLYSYVYLTRSWGPASLNLRADRRSTFLESEEIQLNQLPEVELRVRPTRIGRSSLYWSLVSSANYFSVDRGENLETTYGRADFYPELSYTLPGPAWLSITPRLGGRATYYTARLSKDRTSYEEEPITRTYLEGGVDIVGPSFSKIFNRSVGSFEKFKHLIEPRIEYSYLSTAISDEFEVELSEEAKLARIPRFDEVDSSLITNKVRFSLVNRLFGRSSTDQSTRELASLEVYQDYRLSACANYPSCTLEKNVKDPLYAVLRLTPSTAFTFDGKASYDTEYDNLRSTALSVVFAQTGGYSNLTWYQSYNPVTGERNSSQVRTAFGLRGERKLTMDLHLSYDIVEKEMQQQRAVIQYTGSCWGVSVEYRDQRLGVYPSRDYRIIINLKDVGRLFEIQGGLSNLND